MSSHGTITFKSILGSSFALVCLFLFFGSVCRSADLREIHLSDPANHCDLQVTWNKAFPIIFKNQAGDKVEVEDLVVGDDATLDVQSLSAYEAYLLGRKIGSNNLVIYSKDKKLRAVCDVEIKPDIEAIQIAIKEVAPQSNVTITTANGRIILSGKVFDLTTADRIVETARKFFPLVVSNGSQTGQSGQGGGGAQQGSGSSSSASVSTGQRYSTLSSEQSLGSRGQALDPIINALTIAESQQVLLEVRFLSVSRSIGKELGVTWAARGQNDFLGSGASPGPRGTNTVNQSTTTSSSSSSTETTTTTTFPPPAASIESVSKSGTKSNTETGPVDVQAFPNVTSAPVINAFALGATALGVPYATVLANVISGSNNVDVAIRALERRDLVRRLAEPNLIALSGEKASFVAGGSIPYNTATSQGSGSAVLGQTTFVEFGVKLDFKPTILPSGVINISLIPEVSEPDASIPTSGAGPAILKRKADTIVELRDGQTFIVAGLLDGINRRAVSQVPWIGSLPVIGALFRDTGFQKEETELVILVTPRIIKPLAPYETVASPLDQLRSSSDRELFFGRGDLEVTANQISNKRSNSAEIQPARGHMIDAMEWENADK